MPYGFNEDKSKYEFNDLTTYENVVVSVTPTALSSYKAWDTQENYGYYADITIEGLSENSLIENIILTDTILEAIAPVITTGENKITFYTEDATTLSGYIHLLVVKEVS